MNEEKKTQNLTVSEQLAYSTVKIEVEYDDGSKGSGTGFFFKFKENDDRTIPLIITNKHVINNAHKGYIYMTLADENGNPKYKAYKKIEINDFDKSWILHPDEKTDLAAMPIGPLLYSAGNMGLKLFYISLDESLLPNDQDLSELGAVEDILMVGYPIGLWDEVNNFPIFREGITATHPAKDYNGRKEFLIDAACYPGSSGSPVFLYNNGSYPVRGALVVGTRLKFLGVLWGGPQYKPDGTLQVLEIPTSRAVVLQQSIPINLGFVIKSKEILEFKTVIEDIIKSQKGK